MVSSAEEENPKQKKARRTTTTFCTAASTSTSTSLSLSLSIGGQVTSPSLPSSISVQAKVPSLMGLPVPVRVNILNLLGASQDEILILLLVSKGFYEDCKRPGIVWSIIPTIYIRPVFDIDDEEDFGETVTLFKNLCDHLKNDDATNPKFQRYRRMVVNNVHEFATVFSLVYLQDILRGTTQFFGIVSLDLSSPVYVPASNYQGLQLNYSVPRILPRMLPNLQEVNLSNVYCRFNVLESFFTNCHQLEKVTWNNMKDVYYTCIPLDGYIDYTTSSSNLRELIMDDSAFQCEHQEKLSDLEKYPTEFLFWRFLNHCPLLERLSIRNATYYFYIPEGPGPEDDEIPDGEGPVSQDALIKFVRNAPPSLQWFRSNLTPQNIDMLRTERPGIEFVN